MVEKCNVNMFNLMSMLCFNQELMMVVLAEYIILNDKL